MKNKKVLYGLVAVVLVAMLGVMWNVFSGEQVGSDEEYLAGPPELLVDPAFGATLGGVPYYSVTQADQDLFVTTCPTNQANGTASLVKTRQNGWYQVVALEDGDTVRDTIFKQAKFAQGDLVVAVIWNAKDRTFEALPNKIFRAPNGGQLPLLSLDKQLKKGQVIALNSNRDVEYCAANYARSAGHANVHQGWNLVSKPDFDKVEELAVWTVDFGQPGPVRKFPKVNASDQETNALSADTLYWVYGAKDAEGVAPASIVLETLRTDGVGGTRKVVDNETLVVSRNGNLSMTIYLSNKPEAENVELEFQLFENGIRKFVYDATEIAVKSQLSDNPATFMRGINFNSNSFAQGNPTLREGGQDIVSPSTRNGFFIIGKDVVPTLTNGTVFKVVDKAGNLAERSFVVKLEGAGSNVACTQELRYGLALDIVNESQVRIGDALVLVTNTSAEEVDRLTGSNLPNGSYLLLPDSRDPNNLLVGKYNVAVTKNGFNAANFEVDLTRGDCHVNGQAWKVTMKTGSPSTAERNELAERISNVNVSELLGNQAIESIAIDPNSRIGRIIDSGSVSEIDFSNFIVSPNPSTPTESVVESGGSISSVNIGELLRPTESIQLDASSSFGRQVDSGLFSAFVVDKPVLTFDGITDNRVVSKVLYDPFGKGFWAVDGAGQIWENISSGDGKWKFINMTSPTLVRASSDFYVVQNSNKTASKVFWTGRDQALYSASYSLNSNNIAVKNEFLSLNDPSSKIREIKKSKNDDGHDALIFSFNCENTSGGSGGERTGTDNPARLECDLGMFDYNNYRLLGKIKGDRIFVNDSKLDVWSIDSHDFRVYQFNLLRLISEVRNSPNTTSRIKEIYFSDGIVYGINPESWLYFWNSKSTPSSWERVEIQGEPRTTHLRDVQGFGSGLFFSTIDFTSFRGLYKVGCQNSCSQLNDKPKLNKINLSNTGNSPKPRHVLATTRGIFVITEDFDLRIFSLDDLVLTSKYNLLESGLNNQNKIRSLIDAGDNLYALVDKCESQVVLGLTRTLCSPVSLVKVPLN